MGLEKLIQKIFKNLDQWVPILIIGFAILSPFIKAILEKRRNPPGRRPERDEQEDEEEEREEEGNFFPEPEKSFPREEERPPAPPPRVPEPVFVPAATQSKRFVPIEEESQDVIDEAQSVALEADSVSTPRVEVPVLEGRAEMEPALVTATTSVSSQNPFAGWSPFQIAIVLGGSFDRPAALRDFEEVGPVGLR